MIKKKVQSSVVPDVSNSWENLTREGKISLRGWLWFSFLCKTLPTIVGRIGDSAFVYVICEDMLWPMPPCLAAWYQYTII